MPSSQQRILFFGAPGQLGQAFQYVWAQLPEKPNWGLSLLGRRDCDLTNAAALKNAIHSFKPDLIFNAAAITDIEQAEADEQTATSVNFHAAANMAAQCSSLDIPMIQFSTDQVFDGTKETYLPDDQMNPLNIFGASKMMGEEAVRHELAWHVILRSSWIFSAFRRNILTNAARLLEAKIAPRKNAETLSAPTPATHIMRAAITIAEKILDGKTDGFGTFHLCGAPSCSQAAWIEAVTTAYGNPSAAPTQDKDPKAKLPASTVLDCAKIETIYGIKQRPWTEGLEEAVSILRKGGRTRL